MSLSPAQNRFMPANITSIVSWESYEFKDPVPRLPLDIRRFIVLSYMPPTFTTFIYLSNGREIRLMVCNHMVLATLVSKHWCYFSVIFSLICFLPSGCLNSFFASLGLSLIILSLRNLWNLSKIWMKIVLLIVILIDANLSLLCSQWLIFPLKRRGNWTKGMEWNEELIFFWLFLNNTFLAFVFIIERPLRQILSKAVPENLM